jgi:Domain of unknown function (DUF4333)
MSAYTELLNACSGSLRMKSAWVGDRQGSGLVPWVKGARSLLASIALISLTACGGLNGKKIAADIQEDVTKNGGTSLKTVTCPSGVEPQAGKTFECVGEMDNGYTFTVAVQQQDTKGNVTWDVPHAKGLINLPKLENTIQQALSTEIGSAPSVSCGGVYKAVNPGEGFECQVAYKTTRPAVPAKSDKGKPSKPSKPVEATQTEKASITTDTDGNLSWQRVLPGLALKPGGLSTTPATAKPVSVTPATAPEASPVAPSTPDKPTSLN